jgi:hypothetical protein
LYLSQLGNAVKPLFAALAADPTLTTLDVRKTYLFCRVEES